MLHLKRASAGSGKTYELAKTYIRLLLSYRLPDRQRHLRKAGTLSTALPSIMAVTFTVKATDEMKTRIVDKLAALAGADAMCEEEALKLDYLEDFMEEFRADRHAIAEAAREALRVLLLHYSDFRISTIDSFFQSILHTFAYEVNLDDAFNLEIDSKYVATMGLNAALDTIAAAREGDQDLLHWLREMMIDKSGGNQWNIFQRRDGDSSLYSDLIEKTSELEKEKFKNIRSDLEHYFQSLDRPFREVVKEFDDANIARWNEIYDRRRDVALKFMEAMEAVGTGLEGMAYPGYAPGYIRNSLKEFDPWRDSINDVKRLGKGEGFSLNTVSKDAIKKGMNPVGIRSLKDPRVAEADRLLAEWNEITLELKEKESEIKLWKVYRQMLPQLKIVMEISRLKKEYLEATNSFEISDTNSIIRNIIGEDETPFIYERMGSVINHFLIDEFQDTSRMQWDNFFPLLKDSVDKGFDNLIIGDAKQSIYRFRNADYKLISADVEAKFPKKVILSADDVVKDPASENTNHRSMANVVDFNNYIFSNLTEPDGWLDSNYPGISPIYADCVQAIPKKVREKGLGYVELNFYTPLTTEEKENSEGLKYLNFSEPGLKALPELIKELKGRGYDYSDIGILGRTKKEGNAAVQVLTRYNDAHPGSTIPIISEESLLLKSSTAVRLIVYALEIAAKGPQSTIPVNPVLKEPVEESELFALLNSLQSMALPSVVEAIISRFLPADHPDIAFIAAFQDAVLDYSSTHSSDIGSFLKWWDRMSERLAITSPDESDGVRILTVHKSKGLQYRCVIMPYFDYTFTPQRKAKEWRWIKPDPTLAKTELLPPFVPVETTGSIEGTVHEPLLTEYRREVALDALNSVYVAFTRAIDELYVYGPLKAEDKKNIPVAGYIRKIAEGLPGITVESVKDENDSGEEKSDEVIRYGHPLTAEEIAAQKEKETGKGEKAIEQIDSYEAHFRNQLLQVKDADTTVGMLAEEDDEEDDEENDPRSEGNRKHQIMESVATADDLPRAIKKVLMRGVITAKEADVWKSQLEDALRQVEDYGWFDPGNRVLNERTIIQYRKENRRPDRVVVRPDGTAVVVDYKFGEKNDKYRGQVAAYRDALAETGMFERVEAYLWYVTLGKVEKVV